MAKRGGRLSSGTGQAQGFRIQFHIEGLERTSQEFKQARRGINQDMRDIVQKAGEMEALPFIARAMRAKIGDRWAASLKIKRDRQTVIVASTLKRKLDRALGWLDFGGQRPRDRTRRTGPYTIVRTLEGRRPQIDGAILKGVMDKFDGLPHHP